MGVPTLNEEELAELHGRKAMREQLKKRAIDLATLILALVVVLGAFAVWQRIQAHAAMDRALLELVQQGRQQQATPPAGEPPGSEKK